MSIQFKFDEIHRFQESDFTTELAKQRYRELQADLDYAALSRHRAAEINGLLYYGGFEKPPELDAVVEQASPQIGLKRAMLLAQMGINEEEANALIEIYNQQLELMGIYNLERIFIERGTDPQHLVDFLSEPPTDLDDMIARGSVPSYLTSGLPAACGIRAEIWNSEMPREFGAHMARYMEEMMEEGGWGIPTIYSNGEAIVPFELIPQLIPHFFDFCDQNLTHIIKKWRMEESKPKAPGGNPSP